MSLCSRFATACAVWYEILCLAFCLQSRGSGEHEQQALFDSASLQYGGFQVR
jgi:hypothetical protein